MSRNRVRAPIDEVALLYRAGAPRLTQAILRLSGAIAGSRGREEDRAARALRDAVAESMILSDLLGRRRMLLEADAVGGNVAAQEATGRRLLFREDLTSTVPEVPFREAIADIVRREPRLARTAEVVAEVYRSGEGFAAANAATVQVAERVQKAIASFAQRGIDTPSARQIVADMGNWSEAYAETVYRTNLSTAYNAGRFQQAKDPVVASVIGALRLEAINDADVRRGRPEDHGENHLAGDGLIASVNDPVWQTASPPHGYNCRCAVTFVSRFELERLKLIGDDGVVRAWHPRGLSWFQANFRPHPLFARSGGGRKIYG